MVSRQNWLSASVVLILSGLVSKGLGFLRDIVVAHYWGVGGDVDAFVVATTLPMLLAGAIGFGISTALIPAYQYALTTHGLPAANRMFSGALLLTFLLSLIIMLPIWLTPGPFIQMIAPWLPLATNRKAEALVGWLCPYVLGLNLVGLLTAAYQAIHQFKPPSFSDLGFNIVTILILIACAASWGIHALALGHLFGIGLILVILLALLPSTNKLRITVGFNSGDIKALLSLGAPILLFELFTQLGGVLENYFASALPEGNIAALNFAKKLPAALVLLVALNVARGAFPTLAGLSAARQYDSAAALLRQILTQVTVVFIPLAVFLTAFRKEILTLLYLRGAFDVNALEQTAQAFVFYGAGLWVAAVEPTMLRACYAISDTRTPLISMLVSLASMALIAALLKDLMGVSGIALASIAAVLVRVLIQGAVLHRKVGGWLSGDLFGTIIGALGCAIVAMLPTLAIPTSGHYRLLASGLVFSACYFGVGYLAMRSEIGKLWLLVKWCIPQRP